MNFLSIPPLRFGRGVFYLYTWRLGTRKKYVYRRLVSFLSVPIRGRIMWVVVFVIVEFVWFMYYALDS
nr:MAG TPA: hypothetical protein [Caudoviricetes sp.]DAX34548.1 MAG TPA: hypothetical protein [Caudoviricetes sp.]